MSQGNGFGKNGNGLSQNGDAHPDVISIHSHLKKNGQATVAPGKEPPSNGHANREQLVDFSAVRTQKLEEKRRKTERIFFRNLLGVYTLTGETKMRQIELVDISEEGCSFQVPFSVDTPWPTQSNDLPIRMYFSPDTYLELRVKIVNSRPYIENGDRYVRYGCLIDQSLGSYECYQQFVKFMHLYSNCSHRDLGDVSVFYL